MKTIRKSQYLWLKLKNKFANERSKTIEIEDEEYDNLMTNNQIINESIHFEIIIGDTSLTGKDIDIQDLPALYDFNFYNHTICGNELDIDKLKYVYAKYSDDTYKEITHQIKYHLDKNIGILKSTGVYALTYYPPESINEDTIDLQIIGEYNGYVFNWRKIKLYRNVEIYYNYNPICNYFIDLNNKYEISLIPGLYYKVYINEQKHLVIENINNKFSYEYSLTSQEYERNKYTTIPVFFGRGIDTYLVAYKGINNYSNNLYFAEPVEGDNNHTIVTDGEHYYDLDNQGICFNKSNEPSLYKINVTSDGANTINIR